MLSYKTIIVSLLPVVILALLHFSSITRNDLTIYDTADWWNPNSSYAILKKMNAVRVPYFIKHMSSGQTVVDLGCGGGLVTEEIAKRHPSTSVTGFDMSSKSIEVANDHGRNLPNLSYQVGSIYHLPLSNASVDTVIVSDVFEHLDDLPKALREIHRILKPEGIVVFDTIAKTWWSFLSTYFIAQEVLGIVERGAHDWHMFINPEQLLTLLKDAGFNTTVSDWEGIVGHIDLYASLRSGKLSDLISSFTSSTTDFRSSYMGYAVKTA